MGIKDIKEGMEKGAVFFGIKQAAKNSKKIKSVFVSKDAREKTLELLKGMGLEFMVLRDKADLCKELNLDFESEVISLIK